MRIVLVRVGIDTGSGGIHGPLFRDGSFEFVPIPDRYKKCGIDSRTYGNTYGKYGRPLLDYFPEGKRGKMEKQPIHSDPEFKTFTYGDPNRLKSRLSKLKRGDIVVFYSGLCGWDIVQKPALYIIGFFIVDRAGVAVNFSKRQIKRFFSENFHVRHRRVFQDQKDRLVLVKGHPTKSRLLERARLLSECGRDRRGRRIHVLSRTMQKIFGDFNGRVAIQRSAPRWVASRFIERAATFLRKLK